jgi:hypothetical protein
MQGIQDGDDDDDSSDDDENHLMFAPPSAFTPAQRHAAAPPANDTWEDYICALSQEVPTVAAGYRLMPNGGRRGETGRFFAARNS